jgi:MFS family permease
MTPSTTNPQVRTSRRRDFRLLWTGQSLSLLGDYFAVLALPLLALEVVGASAAQAALLPFALFVPYLVLGLPAGAVVDRLPRRSTMLVCEAVQTATFGAIAVLALLGALTFPLLLALAAVSGCALVFFQVAYTSYLPELLTTEDELGVGNARLFLSESVSRTLGPIIAGPVIAALGAVAAVCANAVSFASSFATLLAIRPGAPRIEPRRREPGWLVRDVREGMAFVFRHDRLEPVITCGVVYVCFLTMIESSLILYCRNVLALDSTRIGLIVGMAGAGFPVGNLLSSRLAPRFGVAWTLAVSAAVAVCGHVLTPIAGALGSVPALIIAGVIHGVGEGVFGPTALTLRQTATPEALLGRVNAVQRFLVWGSGPLGSVFAMVCIRGWGLSTSLWIGGLGTMLCLPMLLRRGVLHDLRPRGGRIAVVAEPT